MKKILLAILIIITGLKIIGDRGALAYKYSIIELAALDDDCKNEKEENKQSQRDNEEMYYHAFTEYSLSDPKAMLAFSSSQQEPYSGYTVKPNTPPPDFF